MSNHQEKIRVLFYYKLCYLIHCTGKKRPSSMWMVFLKQIKIVMYYNVVKVSFNDTVIGEVAKVKYLGHVIANDMTDDADMMRQRCQLYALGNVLSRRFHMCSIEVKNTLFRSFCTPMYTCQLWWNFELYKVCTN